MSNEIKELVNAYMIWADFTDVRINALLNAIQKINPQLREAYELELYELSQELLKKYPDFHEQFVNSHLLQK